jgi:Fanconi anemia group M protein
MLGETLQELGLPLTTPTKDILQMLQQARARQDRLTLFFLAKVRKLQQAILVADTQGPAPLQKYLIGLDTDGSKAAESIRRDYRASKALSLAAGVRIGAKQQKVIKLITNQILTKPDSKILLFCSYRATVEAMVDTLDLAASLADFKIAPGVLVGQTKGMSQKKQQEALQKFREGQINVLVATQVGEEGLDIPAVDLVIHYEPVASGKRSIQRDGRTGRNRPGRIAIIATKDTMDEWMLINSYRRRKSMKVALTGMED